MLPCRLSEWKSHAGNFDRENGKDEPGVYNAFGAWNELDEMGRKIQGQLPSRRISAKPYPTLHLCQNAYPRTTYLRKIMSCALRVLNHTYLNRQNFTFRGSAF